MRKNIWIRRFDNAKIKHIILDQIASDEEHATRIASAHLNCEYKSVICIPIIFENLSIRAFECWQADEYVNAHSQFLTKISIEDEPPLLSQPRQ